MKKVGVILARLTEQDKNLKLSELSGQNLIGRIIKSMRETAGLDEVVIASPQDEFSGYFRQLASHFGCRIYTGDNDNPGRRIKNALSGMSGSDALVIRLNGEMPFFAFNAQIARELIASHVSSGADYSHYNGMPAGISPDVVSIRTLTAVGDSDVPYYRCLISNSNGYRINSLGAGFDMEHLSLCLTEQSDIELFRKVTELYGNENGGGIDLFFERLHEALKSLLEKETRLKEMKYLNQKLNALEKGLLYERLSSMPLKAHIDAHNSCNIRCSTCYQSYKKLDEKEFKQRLDLKDLLTGVYSRAENGSYRIESRPMTLDTYEAIARELFPYLLHCSFGVAGEPLLNAEIAGFLNVARRYEVATSIITNGTLLDKSMSEQFADGRLDEILISFDGATKKTFEKIRRGASYSQLLKNMTELQNIKERLKSQTPVVSLNVTVSLENINELPDIVRMASDIGAASVNVSYAHFFKFMEQANLLYDMPELAREKFLESEETASKKNIALNLPNLAGPGVSEQKNQCPILWEDVSFYTQGQVKPCCFINAEGSFVRGRFMDIWNSDRQMSFRRSFKPSQKKITNCLNCGRKPYRNSKNKNSFLYTDKNFPC